MTPTSLVHAKDSSSYKMLSRISPKKLEPDSEPVEPSQIGYIHAATISVYYSKIKF